MDLRLIILFAILGITVSQKLYFKPQAELQAEDKATCCLDGKHCCPKGTKCDMIIKACINEDKVILWTDAQESESEPDEKRDNSVGSAETVSSVVCPDGAHECESGQTCCPTQDGFACCSFAEGVCCSDNIHCCPKGTVCDVSHSRCLRQNENAFLGWLGKEERPKMDKLVKNQRDRVGAVKCDDFHDCPTGNTCCRLSSGDWGCCPIPNAVCCSDHVHCCPNGYTCDVSSGKCNKDNKQIDWFKKEVAMKVSYVMCDATHECPNGDTCCKMVGGEWGCCPLPDAVCCSDGIHCCPEGTTCDVSSGKCNQGNEQIDWLEKVVAIKKDTNLKDVICPDGSECQDGQTCCRMYDSEVASYGCCPLPNEDTIPLISIVETDSIAKHHQNNIPCSGTSEGCPDGDTCCVHVTGEYKCCPFAEGVCCPDHKFCCSKGYICDEEPGICRIPESKNSWWKFLNKVRAAPLR